jgi:hypothetical protein
VTSIERLDELTRMHEEFIAMATTEERRAEILTKMRGFAEEEMPESRCIQCKHTGFYAPYSYALIEGHCYSHDGMVDYTRITMMCEFCFDKIHEYDEDDDEPLSPSMAGWSMDRDADLDAHGFDEEDDDEG